MTTGNFLFERFETRRRHQRRSLIRLLAQEAGCAFVFIVAFIVILQSKDTAILFAAVSAASAPLLVILVRRLGLGPLPSTAIALAVLVGSIMIAGATHLRTNDLLLAYSQAPDTVFDLTHRMVSDATWAGSGGGTSESLRQLYQSQAETSELPLATSAAIVTIELGRIMFWLIVLFAACLFVGLLRGALLRGRDSFYAAAGAGCLYAILLGGFVNAGFLAAPNYLFASAILGMALAQSASRSQ